MEKQTLTKTGNWIWRDGELSYADFGKMGRMGKDEHILYLSSLDEDELGTNDWYILNQYAPHILTSKKKKEFLSLEDEYLPPTEWAEVGDISFIDKLISTETSEDTGQLPTVEELLKEDIGYLKEYLNEFFKNDNNRWEGDLKFSSTVDNFLDATRTYMLIDELTEVHIRTFKLLLSQQNFK
jgi:hypothetical protein